MPISLFMSTHTIVLSSILPKMSPFRWPELGNDVALATEVAARRPQKPQDWEDIAQALSQAFSTPEKEIQLKGRGCRERMDLLLKKHKNEDAKALKRFVCVCV